MTNTISVTFNKITNTPSQEKTFSQTTVEWKGRRYTLYLQVGDKEKAKLTQEQWKLFQEECLVPLLEKEHPSSKQPTIRVSLEDRAQSSSGSANPKVSEWRETCHKAEKVALTATIATPTKRTPRATKLHGIHRTGNTCYVISLIQMIVSDSTLRKELEQDPVVHKVLQAYDKGNVSTALLRELITHCQF